jgi:hypothetical protein
MRAKVTRTLLCAVLIAISCARSRHQPPPAAERREGEDELARFHAYWLAPAHVAPPTIPFEPRTRAEEAWTLAAQPARPELAAWNQWQGPDARLFNDRAGYLFEIAVDGPGPVRWVPEKTRLWLNGRAIELRPAASPEDLLGPLLSAAVQQERDLLDGDLVDRTRGAGAFRSAYLPVSEQPRLAGALIFPTDEPDRHVTDLELVLALDTPSGLKTFSLSWD